MKSHRLHLAGWLAVASTAVAGERVDHYDVHVDPDANRLVVEARFDGLHGDGDLPLRMADKFAFTALPEPQLDGEPTFADAAGSALESARRGPYEWSVSRGDAETVSARWVVPMTHRDIPEVAQRSAYEFPYLTDDHGMIVTGATFLVSSDEESTRRRVRFHPPDDWSLLAPWAEQDGWYEVADQRSMLNNLVAVGDWDPQSVSIDGAEVVIAFAPGQELLRRRVVDRLAEIVAAELELFDHRPFDRARRPRRYRRVASR